MIHTTSDVMKALFDIITASGLFKVSNKNFVYKFARPATIAEKPGKFAIVNDVTRLKSITESGRGMSDTICRIEIYHVSTNNIYPYQLDELERKVLERFPVKSGKVSFNVLSVLPPVSDGNGYFMTAVNLNTIITNN